jgi:hypothetical protein
VPTIRHRVLSLLLAASALAALHAFAQDSKGKKDDKDPQSTYEPRSKPGEGQKFLQKFVGDWDVVKTFYPRAGGTPFRQTGECKQTMIHDGRFLQSDFIFLRGKTRTTGKGLLGFEAATGTFTSVWTDSRSTRMSFRQGKEKFDGKTIVLYSAALAPDGKTREGRPSRTVTHLEDDGRKIVHRQYNPVEGGKDRLIMELILTRKQKAADSGK